MQHMARPSPAFSCVALACLAGCSGSSGSAGNCVPGANVTCTCPTGQVGARSCISPGKLAECVCAVPGVDSGQSNAGAGGTTALSSSLDAGGVGPATKKLDAGATVTETGGQSTVLDGSTGGYALGGRTGGVDAKEADAPIGQGDSGDAIATGGTVVGTGGMGGTGGVESGPETGPEARDAGIASDVPVLEVHAPRDSGSETAISIPLECGGVWGTVLAAPYWGGGSVDHGSCGAYWPGTKDTSRPLECLFGCLSYPGNIVLPSDRVCLSGSSAAANIVCVPDLAACQTYCGPGTSKIPPN